MESFEVPEPFDASILLLLDQYVCQKVARLLRELLDPRQRIENFLSCLEIFEGCHCGINVLSRWTMNAVRLQLILRQFWEAFDSRAQSSGDGGAHRSFMAPLLAYCCRSGGLVGSRSDHLSPSPQLQTGNPSVSVENPWTTEIVAERKITANGAKSMF